MLPVYHQPTVLPGATGDAGGGEVDDPQHDLLPTPLHDARPWREPADTRPPDDERVAEQLRPGARPWSEPAEQPAEAAGSTSCSSRPAQGSAHHD